MFPEEEFFTLNQVASLWNVTIDKVQHAIMSGKLNAHLWVEKILLHKIEPDSYTEIATISPAVHIDGYIRLFASDCRRLFTKGKVAIRKFPTDSSGCFTLIDHACDIKLRHNDIVITKDEKTRFEIEYKIIKKLSESFTYSNNFKHVDYAGYDFYFGKMEAAIIRQLYEALQTDNPWLYGKTLLKNANSKTIVMHNIFKHKKHWQKLIESNGKGFYRLSSDIAAPSEPHLSTIAAPS